MLPSIAAHCVGYATDGKSDYEYMQEGLKCFMRPSIAHREGLRRCPFVACGPPAISVTQRLL